jgi:type IX secretion system PorP/SprF family membrane protein
MNAARLLKVFFLLSVITAHAQESGSGVLPLYNHYYVAPYYYNPAFIAGSTHTELNVIHRQQWAGFEGAPSFSQLNFIHPISNKMALGVNMYNNKRGLLTTTSAQAAFSYAIELASESYLSFGMAGGVGRNYVNMSEIDTNDPALSNSLNNTYFAEGLAGINLQLKQLSIGVSLPQLFKQNNVSPESFQKVQFSALDVALASVSYKFNLGPSFALQPLVLYRTGQINKQREWEGYTTLYYKNILWAGGIYRPDYGSAAYLGIQIKALQFSYSYEFGLANIQEMTNKTHEIRLGIKLGKQRVKRYREPLLAKKTEEENVPVPVEAVDYDVVSNKPEENKSPVQQNEAGVEEKAIPFTQETRQVSEPLQEDVAVLITEANMEGPKNPLALKSGDYVIVGSFAEQKHAERHQRELRSAGYASTVGFYEPKNMYYVYLKHMDNVEEAREYRNKVRKVKIYSLPHAWVLTVD